MSESAEEVNKTTGRDVAYTTVKAIVDSIPFVGAAASDLLSLIITPPLEKRRKEWMQDIGERLQQLEAEGKIDINTLSSNEQFVDVVIQATALAIKTSQQEKITAFKNIIDNTARGDAPDETKTHIFLSFVNDFTVWHLKLLVLADNPRKWYEINNRKVPEYDLGSNLYNLILNAFPELKKDDELLGLMWEDLRRAGLHNSGSSSLNTVMTGNGVMTPRTTTLGKQFIAFISSN